MFPAESKTAIQAICPQKAILLPSGDLCGATLQPWPSPPPTGRQGLWIESWYANHDLSSESVALLPWQPWSDTALNLLVESIPTCTDYPHETTTPPHICLAIANYEDRVFALLWDSNHRLMVHGIPNQCLIPIVMRWAEIAAHPVGYLWPYLEETISDVILPEDSAMLEGDLEADDDFESIPDMEQKRVETIAMQLPPYQVPENVVQYLRKMEWTEAGFKNAAYELSVPSKVLKFTAVRLGIISPSDDKELRNIRIIEGYASGLTLEELGQTHHVTRERIRQVCKKWRWPTRSELRVLTVAARQRNVIHAIDTNWDAFYSAWINAATVDELASALHIEPDDIRWAVKALGITRDERSVRIRQKTENREDEQIDRLRHAIERRGFTLSDISKAIGRHPMHLSVCIAKHKMPVEYIQDLARILNVPESWLRHGTGAPHWHQDDDDSESPSTIPLSQVSEQPADELADVTTVDVDDIDEIDYGAKGSNQERTSSSSTIELYPMPIAENHGIMSIPSSPLIIRSTGKILSASVDGISQNISHDQNCITVLLPRDGIICDVILRIVDRRRPWAYSFVQGQKCLPAERQVAVIRSQTQENPVYLGDSLILPKAHLPFTTISPISTGVGYKTKRATRPLTEDLSGDRITRLTEDGLALILTLDDEFAVRVHSDDGWFIEHLEVTSERITGKVIAAGAQPLVATFIDFGAKDPAVTSLPISNSTAAIDVSLPPLTHPCRFVAIHDGHSLLKSNDRVSCHGLWETATELGREALTISAIEQSRESPSALAKLLTVCAAMRWFHSLFHNLDSDSHTTHWGEVSRKLTRWLVSALRSNPIVIHQAMLVMTVEQASEGMARMPLLRLAYLAVNPGIELPSDLLANSIPSWQPFVMDYQAMPLTKTLQLVKNINDLKSVLTPKIKEIEMIRQRPESSAINCILTSLGSEEDGSIDDLPRAWLIAMSRSIPDAGDLEQAFHALPVPHLTQGLQKSHYWHKWDSCCLQLAELCWVRSPCHKHAQVFSSHERRSPVHPLHPMHRLWRFYVHMVGSLRHQRSV